MKADVLGGKQRRSFKKATISIILKNTEEQNTFFIPRGMFLQFIFMFTKVIISTLLEPLSERGITRVVTIETCPAMRNLNKKNQLRCSQERQSSTARLPGACAENSKCSIHDPGQCERRIGSTLSLSKHAFKP